jgi:anti-sigma factor RsiW
MRTGRQYEHPSDEKLLAYLDGELTSAELNVIRDHLMRCWKCRTEQAELESQIEKVSRKLSDCSNVDTNRSELAKGHFIEWQKSFEKQNKIVSRVWHPRITRIVEHFGYSLCDGLPVQHQSAT